MPIAKALLHVGRYLAGALLGLYLAAPAYAFNPAQVPLLSAPAVTPNVMLQVDNSGSMDTIITATGYNPSVNNGPIYTPVYSCFLIFCGYSQGNQVSNGTADYVFVGNLSRNGCSGTNAYAFYRNSNAIICITLADPAGGGNTRYPINYLSWLVSEVNAGRSVSGIPTQSRLTTAISVAQNLVQNNRALRIGLAAYNPPIPGGDLGPGGSIKQLVADLSPVAANAYQAAVSQQTADTNYNNLRNAIANLKAESNTPLAETYYQVTRYFRGLSPYPAYNGSPATYTSPIQYRCQKNYGVVITDGLPTYDRTFPNNDPDDPNGWLPNWDRIANDGPGGDDEGDTLYLDDIAKFAYDIDMRRDSRTPGGDLTGKSWDTAGFSVQNMRTYTIGFTTNDQMLIDAADNNHGRGRYFQANDSAALNSALSLALGDIYAKVGSGGGGASNTSTLQTGTRLYDTRYDPADWHGTIRAFDVNATTGDLGSLLWSTDSTITSGANTTFESWNTATSARINLDFNSFSQPQQAAINATLPSGVDGPALINWSKGSANANLRTRSVLLGDVINSPVVAAMPADKTATSLQGDTSYSTYLTSKAAGMISSLLVNSNDGFFNVISAETRSAPVSQQGQRRYAFMPSSALTSLSTIASPSYGSGVHKFTVDGPISVFDTQAGAGSAWRTVAYGATGAGGKAYFAVKLFEVGNNAPSVLWEIKAPDASTPANQFNNLGYAYSKPDVARMADGTGIMVIGNGYGSFTGRASLYVVNANTGAFITEIQTPQLNNETDNGLSSVKLRVNAQNVVQAAYAGDLKGRMWKFDLSGANPSSWKLAFNGQPLFTAPGGANQPITVQPLVLDHPLNGKLVYFGTGKFSETSDKQTTAQQAFYAIWDADSGSGNIVQTNLQPQTISGTVTGSNATYSTSTSYDVDWSSRKGWYLQLATAAPYLGERVIFPAQSLRDRILLTTAAVNSSDPCESIGTSRLFELNAATGSMFSYPVLDTNGDGRINSSDTLVSGRAFSGIISVAAIIMGSENIMKFVVGGDAPESVKNPSFAAGVYQRIMWRQIQ
ncbi:PilC/PilY family type IV pilus protein [uncultured Pseudomonas sp.]|uniref:pilus assembly protein n=1 Tax=uncultured Pseudomonas sp. TaxID=114707 RepID=UPI0025FBDACE|nr:PilC/PilY family type IV pilus protein [uncultured Pseudomonas sp.]